MKKLLFFFLSLFLTHLSAHAQQDTWQFLKEEVNPKKRMDAYSDLAWDYIMAYNDSALIVANLAERDAVANEFLEGQAIAREYQGLYYEIVQSNYAKASEIYLAAADFCIKNNLKYERNIYLTLGVLFHTTDNYEKAKVYYHQSMALAKKAEDNPLIMKCLTNLGSINSSQGNYVDARRLMLESLNIPNDNLDAQRATYGNLGNSYFRQDSFEQALSWLYKSVAEVPGEEFEVDAVLLSYVLDAKTALNEFDDIQQWIDKINAIIEKGNLNLRGKTIGIKAIAQAYKGKKEFETAADYFQKYITLNAELKEKQRDDLVLELEEKYNSEKKQMALQKKSNQNKTLLVFLALSFLLLSALAILFFKNKEKSKLIDQRNNALEKSVAEKNLLLKEIHHRVKNNLQVVSSIFSLQARYIKHPEAKEVLAKGKDRVRSMALLHQNLYQEENFAYINTQTYFTVLIDQLVNSYSVGPQKINLVKTIDNLDLGIDIMLALGLITNELISNALKHAWPDGQDGTLSIRLQEINQQLILQIADDGVGKPKLSEGEAGRLGAKLIQAFANKLKAKIDIDHSKGFGMQFTLTKYAKKPA